jgi:hypothetical protein
VPSPSIRATLSLSAIRVCFTNAMIFSKNPTRASMMTTFPRPGRLDWTGP